MSRDLGTNAPTRARNALVGVLLSCVAGGTSLAADDLAVAWRRDGVVQWHAEPGAAARREPLEKIPLGSLWKLFVYAYLSETGAQEPAYRCASKARPPGGDDDYCCDPGGSIERDEALARSCGPYFEPARLEIGPDAWRRHWQRNEPAAKWLQDLSRLRPQTEVSPAELLAALDAVPATARARARAALLAVLLEDYGREAWPVMGTAFRFKTFSWYLPGTAPGSARRPYGGGAGWLADGTSVWFGAAGSSRLVLTEHAEALANALPPLRAEKLDEADAPCVEVRFFARYPIRRVLAADNTVVLAGTLGGRVVVEFENGRSLPVQAHGRLELTMQDDHPIISGRFSLDEYVARVVDREGSSEPVEAARALAVAARSYVVQQGRRVAACWAIADASATQRVSPNPPSPAALAAARFSEGLTLRTPVRYHRELAGPGQLSWQQTVARARQGTRFDALLGEVFGRTSFAGLDAHSDCERLPAAEAWLGEKAPLWQRLLRRQAGFESPEPIAVCVLPHGQPYSDQRRGRIYVRGWMTDQGRLTLAHEYVHLAFRFHPSGADEAFVERTARALHERRAL
jgi:uncharacterized protein YfaQ (DUF2300 family)